jgi:uncharacterized protein
MATKGRPIPQMLTDSSAFSRYVDQARTGNTALWRTLVGGLLIGIIWLVFSVAAAIPVLTGLLEGPEGAGHLVGDFVTSPPETALILTSFVGLWCGVWLAVRLLQRRPIASVFGASKRISQPDFLRGFVATLIVCLPAELVSVLIDPSLERSAIGVSEWLLWLIPLTLLVVLQISAEEVAFRGYFVQSLAARFPSQLVWALLPGAVFTLLHFDGEALPWMNAHLLITTAAFTLAATSLVVATGNLGAAMGVHLALNFYGLLVVSNIGWLSGTSLFERRVIQAPDWTVGEAAWLTVIAIAAMALVLVLLLDARSPLRVIRSESSFQT